MFTPDPAGLADILVFGGTVHSVAPDISGEAVRGVDANVRVIDAGGCCVVPGLVDQHNHINGAGGEGGPEFRTPPVTAGTLFRAGITSVVGMLGTDGVGRCLQELLMKALGLDREGVSAWILTGAYQLPGPTITGSALGDIMFIDKVIGTKMALSDHRGSHPSEETIRRTISETRRGGILSGKGGMSVVHMGSEKTGFRPIYDAIGETDIPLTQVLPTHCGRNRALLDEAIEWRFAAAASNHHGGGGDVPESRCRRPTRSCDVRSRNALDRNSMSTDGKAVSRRSTSGWISRHGRRNPASLHDAMAEIVLRCGLPLETRFLCVRESGLRECAFPKGGTEGGIGCDFSCSSGTN